MCVVAPSLFAQASSGSGAGPSSEIQRSYQNVKNNLLKSADKMPDADYSFKPTPEIRTFAEVLGHVVTAQSRTCAAASGEGKPVDVTGKTSKADVVAALQESFAICDKAYSGLTDANGSEAIKTPRGQATRLGMLVGNLAHDSEQYGLIAMYLRMKGIVPPSSDRR